MSAKAIFTNEGKGKNIITITLEENNQIVSKNLELMLSEEKGGMMHLLNTESMGGNAGIRSNYPCQAANFCYEQHTGEILYFANPQNLPDNLKAHPIQMFVVARSYNNGSRYLIFEHHTEMAICTREASKNLTLAKSEFNDIYREDFHNQP